MRRKIEKLTQEVVSYANNKASWGPGPWWDEPDRVEFRHAGLVCLIVRNTRLGNLCGYVAVPPEHPLYGCHYENVEVEVHGGLTYSDKCHEHICHVPEPGEPDDVWWLGFDCAHGDDLVPAIASTFGVLEDGSQHYRDLACVRRQTEWLADQLWREK